MKVCWGCPSTCLSFSLNDDSRLATKESIFYMVTYGRGWTFTELYNMPVWLRNFYMHKMRQEWEKHPQAFSGGLM